MRQNVGCGAGNEQQRRKADDEAHLLLLWRQPDAGSGPLALVRMGGNSGRDFDPAADPPLAREVSRLRGVRRKAHRNG